MLEIGIGLGPHYESFSSVFENYSMGGGLKMWRDYFSCAHIYVMDVYECPKLNPMITTFVGDQSNEKDLLHIVEDVRKNHNYTIVKQLYRAIS
jgi:hypothetical protein